MNKDPEWLDHVTRTINIVIDGIRESKYKGNEKNDFLVNLTLCFLDICVNDIGLNLEETTSLQMMVNNILEKNIRMMD